MSRLNSSTYPTGSSTRTCAATGEALGEGDHYTATLVETTTAEGATVLRRVDFSLPAWQGGARPAAPVRLIGSWRATVHAAGERVKPVLDDQAMLDLLEQIEPGDSRRDGLRYVLALMLVRRRLLVAEPSRGETLVLRRRGEAAEIAVRVEVKDPGLDEASLTNLIGELEQLAGNDGTELSGETPGTPATGAAGTGAVQ